MCKIALVQGGRLVGGGWKGGGKDIEQREIVKAIFEGDMAA